MASSSSSIEGSAEGAVEMPLPSSRFGKKSVLLALVAGVLVVGAIFGGVFGAMAVEKKRRVPIPVEAVTYSMVTEGFVKGAVVPVPNIHTNTADSSPANATTIATMTADKAPAGTGLGGQPSIFSYDYWFGHGGIGAIPMFDPMPLVIPPGAVTVPTWSGAWANGNFANTQGRVVCFAKTGEDVMDMVSGDESACEVVILSNDRFTPYSISKTLNVTKPKLLIGRPIYLPMLNCTNRVTRLFDILPGGRLEARNVIMVRGFGTNLGLNGNEISLNVGTIARVQVGGQFSATSCMFRERNNTLPTFIHEVRRKIQTPTARNRQFGQMILVLGGTLTLTGCRSLRFRPFGNGILNAMVIGRDINVVAGMCTLIGHNTASASLWSVNYFISGSLALVMGGVLTMIGGNNIGANFMQVQAGTMVNFGTFAGTLVTIGYGYTSVKGLLFRNVAGQFGTIAGVSIMVAFIRGSADALKYNAGAGGTHATMTGVNNRHSGAETGYTINGCFFGLGGSNYVSSGTNFVQAVPRIGTYLTVSSNGAGLSSFMGAGTSTNSYTGQLSVQMIRFNAGVATDLFLGAGWHTNINASRFSIQLVNAFLGVGNQLYVGFGGAVFIRTYSLSIRRVQYNPLTRFTYTVAGTGVGSSGTRGQNLVVTKGGVTRYIFNKTSGDVTKLSGAKVQWTPGPTSAGGAAKKRKALVRRRAVEAKDIGADVPNTMGSWLKDIVDAAGGFDPSITNKLVVLQSTITNKQMLKPPHPSQFRGRRMQEHLGGYTKILFDGLVDMDDREAIVTPGLVSANNSDCFLCNVGPGNTSDHVGGPGGCEVKDVCGSGANPAEIYSRAQNATATNILPPRMDRSMGKVDADGNPIMTNTWMLWHELVVYCYSSDPETDDSSINSKCLSADYIKDVIKAYILMDSDKNEYQIAVSDANIHAAVNAFPDSTLDDLKTSVTPQWNQECQGWTKYDIRLLADDPEVEQHILDVMEGFVEDITDLQTTILENANPSAELQPCAITITEKGEQRYPSFKNMPAFKPSQRFTLGPNVVIADGVSIEPVKLLSPGETYTVFVQNFPKGSKIDLKLMDGVLKTGPVVASIASFDDNGISEVRWTVPRDFPLDGGKRYLRAEIKDIPALFSFSQVFYVEDENSM